MKLEIDFAKPDELLRTKRELEIALKTINAALEGCESPTLAPKRETPPEASQSEIEPELIKGLPVEFTTPQAVEYGRTIGYADAAVRSELAQLAADGWLTVKIEGSGRRATLYRKS